MIDLAKMIYQIATAGHPHDAERCKTCAYRDSYNGFEKQKDGYCYMWYREPPSLCHHHKADK